MKRNRPEVGTVFSRWTVLDQSEIEQSCICRCQCGTVRNVFVYNLKSGISKSCGCLHRENMRKRNTDPITKHGHTRGRKPSPEYVSWKSMIQRCYDGKTFVFRRYGAAGIRVCDRWRYSFENFLEDMGARLPGKSLDRFPVKDGNYCPENCRWATRKEQNRNRKSNRIIYFRGESMCLADFAEKIGMEYGLVRDRTSRGWSAEKIASAPLVGCA